MRKEEQSFIKRFRNELPKSIIVAIILISELIWLYFGTKLSSLIFKNAIIEQTKFLGGTFIILIGGIILCGILVIFVFNLDGREQKEKKKEILKEITEQYKWDSDGFSEIQICPSNIENLQYVKILINTLNESDCKFYIRIAKDNEIELVKKNGEGKLIGNPVTINDLIEFKRNTKPM